MRVTEADSNLQLRVVAGGGASGLCAEEAEPDVLSDGVGG